MGGKSNDFDSDSIVASKALLTLRLSYLQVEELKGQEGTELTKLNVIYTEKKQKVRQME